MVTLILFATGVALAYLLGVVVGSKHAKSAPTPSTPVLTCGCGHSVGFHKSMAGECHAQVIGPGKGYTYRGADGSTIAKQCQCQCYDGPEPLPRSWIPPKEA